MNEENESIIEKEIDMTEPQKNKPPLDVVVVKYDSSKYSVKRSFHELSEVNQEEKTYMSFNQRFLNQITLLDWHSVKKFAPNEWLNHLNSIDHPFHEKLKKAKNTAIQRVLRRRDFQRRQIEVRKLEEELGVYSDFDDDDDIEDDDKMDNEENVESQSQQSDKTDPYYLPTDAELFKVLNRLLEKNTLWDFPLQRTWFHQDNEFKEYTLFCPCSKINNKWLKQEGIHDFVRKKISIYCCQPYYFKSGKQLFDHVAQKAKYDLLHLGIMHYMTLLYPDEIKTIKKPKKVSVHGKFKLDVTNSYTFSIKR